MAGLTEIRLHDLFHSTTQRRFTVLANYVSDLYVQCLQGHRPPTTKRLVVGLVPARYPSLAIKNGAMAGIDQFVDAAAYDGLPEPAKLRFLLERLHAGVGLLCRQLAWDPEPFDQAYRQVVARNLKFRVVYPEQASRDGRNRAHLVLEKTLTRTRLLACLAHEGRSVQALLHEGPNRWWGDPVYQLVARGRWLTNDRFGVRTSRPPFHAWYSLQSEKVGPE